MKRPAFVLLASLVALPLAAPAAAPKPFELADFRSIVSLSAAHIAPDGNHVVLVVRRANFKKDTYANELVLVDTRTRAKRVLTHRRDDVGDPQWSPSGDRLAFTASDADHKTAQLFVMPMDGGDALRLTDGKEGVGAYKWRPDGRAFALTMRDRAPNQKAIDAHQDAFDVGDDHWATRATALPSHIWTIDANGNHLKRITSGAFSVGGLGDFTRDGKRLVYTQRADAHFGHYRDTRIGVLDLASGRTTLVTPVAVHAAAPNISPDGTKLAYSIEDPKSFSQADLAVANLDGSGSRIASARLDRNLQFAVWRGDGRAVYIGANDRTRAALFLQPIDGGPQPVDLGDVNLSDEVSLARNGAMAFIGSTPTRASELYLKRTIAAAPQRLTGYNDALASHAIGRSKTIVWTSADHYHLDGVLTYPIGFTPGKTYPLVLEIHGGPTATSTDAFSELPQLFASHGYLVFQPNYRGSDNSGGAFAQATVPHITSAPAQDCMDGLAALEKLGIVDTKRIGVSGWSEGGLMTSWLIGHWHVWKAAVSGAAVNDWVAYSALTDASEFTPNFIGGSPWTSDARMKFFEAESPLTYAGDVTTPTLILSDTGDQRVPTPLSYAFYHALLTKGTEVQFVAFPTSGHFPSDPLKREDVDRRWFAWLDSHLR